MVILSRLSWFPSPAVRHDLPKDFHLCKDAERASTITKTKKQKTNRLGRLLICLTCQRQQFERLMKCQLLPLFIVISPHICCAIIASKCPMKFRSKKLQVRKTYPPRFTLILYGLLRILLCLGNIVYSLLDIVFNSVNHLTLTK